MRIVIDLQACQNGSRQRGIGRYAMAVTRALIALDRGHTYRIMLSDAFPDTIAPIREALADVLAPEHILACAMPGGGASANPANAWRTRAAEIVRAQFIEALAPDLLFIPSLFEGYHDAMITSVERAAYRTAVTLFDFIPIEYPDHYLPDQAIRMAYHRKLGQARAADLLLPISHYVAGQAAARLGEGGARLVAVPLGVEPMFRPPRAGGVDRPALMRRHGIVRPFVLNTSPLEHRKNIPGLVAGFAALPRRLRDTHQLVIVGRMDERAHRTIAALAAKAGLPGDAVVLAGFVPDEDLVALYSECALFAFPSISEGFGLPVLEAMACGAPVVGSATTSIPEVIGRDDLLFDPADPQAIAKAMAHVLDDPALQTALRRYGPNRAAGFTWEATAEATLRAFEALGPADCAPPAIVRPRSSAMAVVVPTMAGDPALAGQVAVLLPELARRGDVTLICAEGDVADMTISANFEMRDFAWFERHAPRFACPIYLSRGDETGAMLDLMRMYPGVLLSPGAAGGRMDGQAIRALAMETLDVGLTPGTIVQEASRLAASLDRCASRIARDPARRLADQLPAAVRDVRPSRDDLTRVALALARNEATLAVRPEVCPSQV